MILKISSKAGMTHYQDLGNGFAIIDRKKSPEEFENAADTYFGKNKSSFIADTIMFISFDSKLEPIYIDFDYRLLKWRFLGLLSVPVYSKIKQKYQRA